MKVAFAKVCPVGERLTKYLPITDVGREIYPSMKLPQQENAITIE